MNQSTKAEINQKLEIISAYSEKLVLSDRHAIKAAVWDIKSLVNESTPERFTRELDELLEKLEL